MEWGLDILICLGLTVVYIENISHSVLLCLLSILVAHGVKMLYDGEEVDLKPHEEEA